MRCLRGPGSEHSQTFRHRRGGLLISDGVGGVLNLTNMQGSGDHVTRRLNNDIRDEQLLGIAKIRGFYQGTALDVPSQRRFAALYQGTAST